MLEIAVKDEKFMVPVLELLKVPRFWGCSVVPGGLITHQKTWDPSF